MLYTTYLAKLSSLPDNIRKVLIMRWEPKHLDRSKHNIEHMPDLAPSYMLLARYKDNNISFSEFTELFKDEMLKPSFQKCINDIKKDLDNNLDVAIICCEKDKLVCHRDIIAQDLIKEGYAVKEWEE